MIDRSVIQRAKSITRQYGRGFYRASLLFSTEVREATWVLYAFVRIPDEMVDSQKDMTVAKQQLDRWSSDWHRVTNGEKDFDCDPILFATKEIFDNYHISYQYSLDFLLAMYQDLVKDRYESYSELERYMYGSASVVGIMMSHIIGFKDGALPYAKSLGEAFQLINFLRDVTDDYESRGRIYLPKEDMDRFGITENHVAKGIVDAQWKAFMKFEITRAKELLAQGYKGIPLLFGRGQKAVYASYLIYGKIIEEIEKAHYDIFSKRIVVSPLDKTMLLCKAIWKKNQS